MCHLNQGWKPIEKNYNMAYAPFPKPNFMPKHRKLDRVNFSREKNREKDRNVEEV